MKIILKNKFNECGVDWFIKCVKNGYLYIRTNTKFTTRIALCEIENKNEIDFTNKIERIKFN